MSNWLRNLILGLALAAPLMALEPSDSGTPATTSESSEPDTVSASTGEWDNFNYEEMGMTQWEFQQVREAGISKDKLMSLIELGVRPSEYLQRPWEPLGVTEPQWLAERGKGMEDSDIDRSYRNKAQNQSYAYWSALVPSLYQWKTGKITQAITMDAIWLASAGVFAYLAVSTPEADEAYAILPLLAMHVWSFADGLIETQWENNPDANRFSWGIAPMPQGGWAGVLGLRF
jgi:hypothetical protein